MLHTEVIVLTKIQNGRKTVYKIYKYSITGEHCKEKIKTTKGSTNLTSTCVPYLWQI